MNKKALFPKDFLLVVVGQIISLFGNQILRYALPLYLLTKTGSAVLFGTILACSFVPMILLCPIGGTIADRVNKKNIMVTLDFSTGILVFLFYLLIGKIDIVPLIAVTMMILYGIQGAYQPAVQASIPILVENEHIVKANSVVNLISSLANMGGPVIGGLLYSFIGLVPILYVSIGCFFTSAIMEIFIHIPFKKKITKGNIFTIGFNDIKESFHFVLKKQTVLWKVSLIFALINLLFISLNLIGIPVIITQHLGFSPNTANLLYGYAQGNIGAGSLVGSLIAIILSNKLKAKISPFLLIGCSFAILLEGFALQVIREPMVIYIILLIGCNLLMILATLLSVQMMTYMQVLTPEDLIGKVISCVLCICMCTNPLGQFIYGIVFEYIGNNTYLPFYIVGIIMIVISILTRSIFCKIDILMEQQIKSNERKVV